MEQIKYEILRERLRETFNGTTQEEVGRILGMTQGNVSKLLSGAQSPVCDTLFKISKAFGVSVDWLLGLSDVKTVSKSSCDYSYSNVVNVLEILKYRCAEIETNDKSGTVCVSINDPLLYMLMRKVLNLHRTDLELWNQWKETKLSLFADKEILCWSYALENDDVRFLASQASNEYEWLQVYEKANNEMLDFIQMLDDSPSPFER